MITRRGFLMSGLPATALMLTGCGGKGSQPTTVHGDVTYRGLPLPGGHIVFVPDEDRGNSGSLYKGLIGSDGKFNLGDTVPPGWYRVAIAPQVHSTPTIPTVAVPYPGPPARYRNPKLSGLSGEVKPATGNVFVFELDDA